jgi:tRNA A-37 threonylcarbamoyl transferase component Bud32
MDLLARVTTALADRYAVERLIGHGGMATVFLARDLRYERQVAVKVLRPDLSATLGSERFLREIRITAQLNHPHILPLLDSGEADDLLYYVMPYMAGGSLRHVLQHGPTVPLPEVLRLAGQVASALDHAHRHGVVHRDVKPENILLSEGHAVVADFGIARAVSSAAATESALTRSGFPLGTPGYMSPEQATGTLHLDARTDVFGLACVVYEMLVGETPEMWPTEEAIRLGRFVDASPAHRERLDRLPGHLQQALVRGLAVRPALRYATPLDLTEALAGAAEHSAALSAGDVDAVLRRAAELQLAHPTEDPALSIGAVEQIAAEVGIPPEHVRAALDERQPAAVPAPVTPAAPASPTPATGDFDIRKKLVRVQRVVHREATPDDLPGLVSEIHETLGLAGHASIVGQSLTWSPAGQGPEGRAVLVMVNVHDGQSIVHVEERLALTGFWQAVPGLAGAGGAFMGMLLGIGLGGGPGPHMLVPALLGAAGSAYLAVRGIITTMANVAQPQLVALAGRLAARIAGTTPPPLPAGPPGDRPPAEYWRTDD